MLRLRFAFKFSQVEISTNIKFRTSYLSQLLDLRSQSSLGASKFVAAKTDGESSTLRMRTTANLFTSETSLPALTSKI